MKPELYETLTAYCHRDMIPMHMPGHKRKHRFQMENPYELDVTEVEGLDDLHHPTGMIRDLQERISLEYGADESYLLVNGSTCGILAAITACCRHGDYIMVARNCHKSVYHAIRLLGLKPVYIYPSAVGGEMDTLGIAGVILPETVSELLKQVPKVACVVISSPTYEGVVSPVAAIAEKAHERGVPLIVDEAHGAHFHWHEYFPDTALSEGADLVIESMHKTLPSFTQTALLHVRSGLVQMDLLRWSLQVYQTSSPSYLLMAGMDHCISYLQEEGREDMDSYVRRLEQFRKQMSHLRALRLFESEKKEISKLVFATDRVPLSGNELAERLRWDYHIETEMSCGDYVIAMTSVADEDKDFERLSQAILQIDTELLPDADAMKRRNPRKKVLNYLGIRAEIGRYSYEAAYCANEWIPLSQSVGRLAAEAVYPYPPGIPILVEGERITEEIVELLKTGEEQGMELRGIEDGKIRVLR